MSESGKPLLDALEKAGKDRGQAAKAREIELFCVKVGGENFAVESGLVHEVVRISPITPLPGSPAYLLGVTAHRGDVVAVVDLARFLGRGETQTDGRSRMAIARADGMVVGIIADQLLGLTRFKAAQLQPAPLGADAGTEFISGVITEGAALNVLDLRRALSAARARTLARK